MDFERCDPEVFEAVLDILDEQGREAKREQEMERLKASMGR